MASYIVVSLYKKLAPSCLSVCSSDGSGVKRVQDGVETAVIHSSLNLQVIRMVGESAEPAVGVGAGGVSGNTKMPTLEEYGTNLTKLAEDVSCRCSSCTACSCLTSSVPLKCGVSLQSQMKWVWRRVSYHEDA